MFFDSQAVLHLCLNCLEVYRVLSPQFSSPLRRIVSKCSGAISGQVWVLPLCSSNFACCRGSIGFILTSILRKEVRHSLRYGFRLLSTRYWELYYRIGVGPESRGIKYLEKWALCWGNPTYMTRVESIWRYIWPPRWTSPSKGRIAGNFGCERY